MGEAKVPVHLGDLRGPGGNVFAVLGNVKRAFRDVGRAPEFDEFQAQALTADYEHVLDTVLVWCDDLDGSIAGLRMNDEEDDEVE